MCRRSLFNMMDDNASDEEGVSIGNQEEEDCSSDDEELAEVENRAVSCLRGTVIIILVSAALLISLIVHHVSSRAEAFTFVDAFNDASTVLEAFRESLGYKLGAIDSLAIDLSSFARATHSEWPLVTLPEFERRAANTRDMTEAEFIMLLPFVSESSLATWESYSVENQDWLVHGQQLEGPLGDASRTFRMLGHEGITPHVFNQNGRCTGEGPFAPLWQTSPLVPGLDEWVNFDLFSWDGFQGSLKVLLDSQLAVMGEVMNLPDQSSPPPGFLPTVALPTPRAVDSAGDPASVILYPVIGGGTEKSVVGVLAVTIPLKAHFTNALAHGSKGVVAVVRNKCGQTLTFSVDGASSEFLGIGDLHDSRFDEFEKSLDLFSNASLTRNLHAAPLNPDYCSYSLSVFPSQAMHDAFAPTHSLAYAVLVALIFVLAAAAFVFYDNLVEQRQKVVMNRALQSTAIVSSLFPSNVRDRILNLSEPGVDDESTFDENQCSELAPFMVVQPAKQRLKSFLTDHEEGPSAAASKPIADLFPQCTVLFADISGFTAWSSLRDPAQVFTLLESVYQTFDRIARRRGVFKVETIGDSYVAVTGLPEPQEDHAVIMCRFARDCRARMTEVTRKLELTLGPDTGDLRMRFGLHSGPVTAGVLRGEKSRFQLFGDTGASMGRCVRQMSFHSHLRFPGSKYCGANGEHRDA